MRKLVEGYLPKPMNDPSSPAVSDELVSPTPEEPTETAAPAQAATPAPPPPEPISLNALQVMPMAELNELAAQYQMRRGPRRTRHFLVNEIARSNLQRGGQVLVDGILEFTPDKGGGGILRWPAFSFLPCLEDVFVPGGVIRQFGLRSGNRIEGDLRASTGGKKEKLMTLNRLTAIEGVPVEQWQPPKQFDLLTPLFPQTRIILESANFSNPTVRAIDLVATLGQGQRGLIVAPPRAGKTVILKNIAKAIRAAYPDIHLILLLVDERPEEVTDFKREIAGADVFSSTFDEPPTRHIQVAELVSERAKRLVEMGKHVFILLDSITRLSRGYNALQSGKGRIMSGGVEAKALIKPKKFFSAARNTEEGGSLTILATALVDTNSRMDDVIFEEFKGTGNMELHLDRSLLEKRIYPALHILKSGTRREELLYHPDELTRLQLIRKKLAELPALEAMEVLLSSIQATKTNAELLLTQFRY